MRVRAAGAALLALLAACGGPSGTSSPPDYTGKTLALGAVLSLTGAGAALGVQQKQGIQLGVEVVNRAGLLGGKLTVDIQDDGSDQATGASLMKSFAGQKKVLGVLGPTLANTATAALPAAAQGKTPVIATSLTGPGVVGDWVFRDSLGEATAIPANVKAAGERFHPRTAVLMYADDDRQSFDGAQVFRQAFADNGISVAMEVPFPKATSVFSDLVAPAVAKKADLWAISAIGDTPAKVILEARTQGFKGPLLGGDGFNTAAVSSAVGEKGSGAQSACAYYPGLPGPANQAFVTAFRSKYKDDQGKAQQPGELAAQAYTAVLLFAEAAKAANLGFTDAGSDRSRLRDALARTSIDSPLGRVGFTSAHDVRQDVYVVAMDGKGGFALVTTFRAQ